MKNQSKLQQKNNFRNSLLQESFNEYVFEKNQGKEEIDLYNENREYIRTIYRQDDIGKNEWKKCILCFIIDKKGNVIVENKKNGEKDGCSGHIKHYEVATQAMLRELYEELGIEIDESLKAKHIGNIKISFEDTNDELQCFLDVYCLFRTKENPIKMNNKEIRSIESVPYKDFLKKFVNNEIFPYVSEYQSIVHELEKLFQEKFMGRTSDRTGRE